MAPLLGALGSTAANVGVGMGIGALAKKKFPGGVVFVSIEEDERLADLVTAVWGAATSDNAAEEPVN